MIHKESPAKGASGGMGHDALRSQRPMRLRDIDASAEPRIDMHDEELNRVLGGGLVKGSLVLLGGEPGIGKSTLVMQTVLQMPEKRILYVSGEESQRQLKLRADRLQRSSVNDDSCLILCETNLEQIFKHIKEVEPDIVIIDSIQTIYTELVDSSPGNITQVRECAAAILRFAKESHTAVILIGHINKEGTIAGPKILEHIVDTVLQFEGDQHYMYRILRSNKNRFGSTDELGIYEMRQDGLRQVSNPSELLLNQEHEGMSGIAIAGAIEGVRPLLIEVQALVSSAVYGYPQRSATGFDLRRMNMLLAVLEKRVGFKLAQKDVFLNIAGGLRVNDTAIDLAVISAILSSNMDAAIEPGVCMAGEIGLSGEIRPVSRIMQRISEAQKLGFKRFILPKKNLQGLDVKHLEMELVPVRKVEEAFRMLFG
jgi:DNA repair protein RadA/Sms